MNVVEAILVLVGIPLAIVLLLAALTLLPGGRRPRYRPGQPWEHEPVWYEPHPDHGPAAGTPGERHGETQAIGSSLYGELPAGGHGVEAHGDSVTPHPPVPAGPLGGARGTW